MNCLFRLWQTLNYGDQSFRFLQPSLWIGRVLVVTDDTFTIDNDRGGLLDNPQRPLQIVKMIDRSIWVGEDRKRRFDLGGILARPIE